MPTCTKCGDAFEQGNKTWCRHCYNAYMREYNNKRYHRRRAEAIERLGGKCVRCGSTEQLEFDHAERSSKEFDLGKWFNGSDEKFLPELAKCQLLCHECHRAKTDEELSVEHGGGITGKRNCYCEKCAPLKKAYNADWYQRVGKAQRKKKKSDAGP